MLTSYHNHTVWSDGTATLAEMIDGARRAGLDELGISDHFVLAPDNQQFSWAMDPGFLAEYVSSVRQAGAKVKDLTIRLGLEVDYFPETIELVAQRLAPYSLDYIIGSVHFVDGFRIDDSAQPWGENSQDFRDQIWRRYWQHMRAAAETKLFDMVGHFDLPKKFNYYPSVDLTEEALTALDAIAAAQMAIEINTSGWNKTVQEAYPSLFYLREANLREIPLVINSDAHAVDDVAGHFARARALAAAAGYGVLAGFDHRQRFTYPLVNPDLP
jgi:histidinol-phosphatase (PHP family)